MKLTTEKLKELIKEEIEKLDEGPFDGPTRAKTGDTRAPSDPNDPFSGPTRAKTGDTRAPSDPNDPFSGPTRADQKGDSAKDISGRVAKLEQVVNQLVAAIKKNN